MHYVCCRILYTVLTPLRPSCSRCILF